MPTDKKVFITHFDALTCGGANSDILWTNILNQKSGIALYDGFLPQKKAAIGKFDTTKTFQKSLIEITKSVINKSGIDTKNAALFVGSSVGGMQNTENLLKQGCAYSDIDPAFHAIGTIKNILKPYFEFKETFAFSTACTSGANALGFAFECLKKGVYENAVVIGADAISLTTVSGFDALGVLSPDICKPFCETSGGMNVSEGIGVLTLSNEIKSSSVQILGVGYSSDAYHMTHPKPNGEGARKAMSNALRYANLSPNKIDYINAHGTGTKANDTTEAFAIASLFGDAPYVSSTKNIIGHTLGAAGAIEAIIACMAILENSVPPNGEISQSVSKECKFAKSHLREEINYAISNSFAFGGNNTSLIFGKIR